jgi:hypothetical protein
MPWGLGKKVIPSAVEPAPVGDRLDKGVGSGVSPVSEAASAPLPMAARFRVETEVRIAGLYSVIGELEQGTLKLPTSLKRLRVTPTLESGVAIPIVSAMVHHKTIYEVPTGLKVGLTLAYEFDTRGVSYLNRVPNLYGLENGDILVNP